MSFKLDAGAFREFGENMARKVVEAGAIIARDEVVTFMDPGPERTGRTYPIPGTDSTYTASAPGQPPAIREGAYRDSWQASPAVRTGDVVRARAFTARRVGPWLLGSLLEHGTGRMAPRPHVRPALHAAADRLSALVDEANGNAG